MNYTKNEVKKDHLIGERIVFMTNDVATTGYSQAKEFKRSYILLHTICKNLTQYESMM